MINFIWSSRDVTNERNSSHSFRSLDLFTNRFSSSDAIDLDFLSMIFFSDLIFKKNDRRWETHICSEGLISVNKCPMFVLMIWIAVWEEKIFFCTFAFNDRSEKNKKRMIWSFPRPKWDIQRDTEKNTTITKMMTKKKNTERKIDLIKSLHLFDREKINRSLHSSLIDFDATLSSWLMK